MSLLLFIRGKSEGHNCENRKFHSACMQRDVCSRYLDHRGPVYRGSAGRRDGSSLASCACARAPRCSRAPTWRARRRAAAPTARARASARATRPPTPPARSATCAAACSTHPVPPRTTLVCHTSCTLPLKQIYRKSEEPTTLESITHNYYLWRPIAETNALATHKFEIAAIFLRKSSGCDSSLPHCSVDFYSQTCLLVTIPRGDTYSIFQKKKTGRALYRTLPVSFFWTSIQAWLFRSSIKREVKVPYGGGCVHVWAGISSESRTELVLIENGIITAER